jgi:Xaa-Pro aminopeptidase
MRKESPLKPHRIREFQKKLLHQDIAAAIIMQPRDLFYYSGTSQPCNLIIPQKGDPLLLVRRGESFVQNETWIASYEKGGGPRQILEHLKKMGISRGGIGMEFDVIPYGLVRRMETTLDEYTLVDISPFILEQRMVKDEDEIRLIQEATNRFDLAHEVVLKNLRPGISEVELGSKIAKTLIRHETEQIIFIRRWDDWLQPTGTIASGENLVRISGHAHTVTGVGLGPALPWGPSGRTIQKGDLMVIDNPLNYRGYHSDNTRTYVAGEASPKQKEIYQDLLEVQDTALSAIRPGLPVNELFACAMDKVTQLGYDDYFQGYGGSQGKYLGHGVGLELDELPVIDARTSIPIAENMILAVECKFIIPNFGAVFIEDTIIVTERGAHILSKSGRGLAEVDSSGVIE